MRSYKFPIILFSASLATACVHYTDQINQELTAWVGKHPDQLVEAWGAPRSVYVMEKGNKVLSYESTETINRSYGYYRRMEVYSFTDSCKISFFTDSSQKAIERFSYSGTPGVCLEMTHAAGKAHN